MARYTSSPEKAISWTRTMLSQPRIRPRGLGGMRPWHQHLPRKHPSIYQARIIWNGIEVNQFKLKVTTDFKAEKNWLDAQFLTSLEIRQGVHQDAQLCELAIKDYLATFNFFIWLSSTEKKIKGKKTPSLIPR